MDRFSARERALLGVCGAAVLMALVSQLVVRPIMFRLRALSRDIETMEAKVEAADLVLGQKDDIERQYVRVKEHLSRVEPGVDPGAVMLTEVERMAAGCGANLLTLKIQGSEKGEFFEEHMVRADVEGTMKSLMSLLYELETSPQLLRVRRIDLAPGEELSLNKRCSLLITKVISI